MVRVAVTGDISVSLLPLSPPHYVENSGKRESQHREGLQTEGGSAVAPHEGIFGSDSGAHSSSRLICAGQGKVCWKCLCRGSLFSIHISVWHAWKCICKKCIEQAVLWKGKSIWVTSNCQANRHIFKVFLHFVFSFRPTNPIEFLAAFLLKNKSQFEDRNWAPDGWKCALWGHLFKIKEMVVCHWLCLLMILYVVF